MNAIIYVGKEFQFNSVLYQYVHENATTHLGEVSSIHFFQESDKNLFLSLENLLKLSNNLLLVTTKQTYSVVSKLLCTISGDNLITKDSMLMPSLSTVYDDYSYLLEYESHFINVIQVEASKTLPRLLLETKTTIELIHLFAEELQSAKNLLQPIAHSFDISLHYSQLVDGWLVVQVTSNKYGDVTKFIHSVRSLLPKKVIVAKSIARYIVDKLLSVGQKITFAESCTGGLLASLFTKESGVSAVFDGSLVSYSNPLKSSWLAVSDNNLTTYGAVSEEVVYEMLDGAMHVTAANMAIAISGIAGPTGGTEEKPVGTVVIGVRRFDEVAIETLLFDGDRQYIQYQSAYYAIKMLLLLDNRLFFENS
jgi:nicotinamide-nucleotide amidase